MTAIQWTDATVNPIIGCSKLSAGCANCYASDLAASMVRRRLPIADRYREVLDTDGKRWNGKTAVLDGAALERLKVPRRKRLASDRVGLDGWRRARVFLGSMTDMFHETLDFQRLAPVWRWMARFSQDEPGPIWQIVTKRPHRARELLPVLQRHAEDACAARPTIHLLTSTEDQEAADERVPHVLACRPWVELVGLSMEPLLGPVVLRPEWLRPHDGLSWVIIGGESGDDHRPCDLDWIESLVRQCRATGTATFVKQLGANPWWICAGYKTRDPKGGDPSEWPAELRVREFPR